MTTNQRNACPAIEIDRVGYMYNKRLVFPITTILWVYRMEGANDATYEVNNTLIYRF